MLSKLLNLFKKPQKEKPVLDEKLLSKLDSEMDAVFVALDGLTNYCKQVDVQIKSINKDLDQIYLKMNEWSPLLTEILGSVSTGSTQQSTQTQLFNSNNKGGSKKPN